jgi:hypothetical protein
MNIEIPTEDGELLCVICYDKIGHANAEGVQEQPVQLECQHVFGNICLDSWLAKKSRCPICRTKIDGYDTASSSEEDDGSDDGGSDASDEESEEESGEDMDSDPNRTTGYTESEDDSDEWESEEGESQNGAQVNVAMDGNNEDGHTNAAPDPETAPDANDGDDGDGSDDDANSATTAATHQTTSSAASLDSAMSLDSNMPEGDPGSGMDSNSEDDLIDDSDVSEDSDGEAGQVLQHANRHTMTPQEILRRLTANSAVGGLFANGVLDLNTFLNQPGQRFLDSSDDDHLD